MRDQLREKAWNKLILSFYYTAGSASYLFIPHFIIPYLGDYITMLIGMLFFISIINFLGSLCHYIKYYSNLSGTLKKVKS